MTTPAPAPLTADRGPRLSVRDEAKPFILIAAVAAGIGLNRVAGGSLARFHWIVQAGLFIVIFSIMAFVEIRGVGQAFRKLEATALAVTTNYIIVPLFAWSLGWLLLHDYPDLWAGVILYTLTPCIGWYLIFIDLAKGNMQWGLAMLPVDIILQLLLLPIYLWLLIGNVVPIDITTVIRSVAVFLVLPFAAAYAARNLLIAWRGRTFTYGPYKHVVGELKLWALVAVVIGIFATQPRLASSELGHVGLIIATITLFFIGVFVIALAIGRIFKLGYADTTTMVFEITARNSESVIGVAAVAFAGRPLVTLAILIGPIVELPALLALSRLMLRLRKRWTWPDVEVNPTTVDHPVVTKPSAGPRRLRVSGRSRHTADLASGLNEDQTTKPRPDPGQFKPTTIDGTSVHLVTDRDLFVSHRQHGESGAGPT